MIGKLIGIQKLGVGGVNTALGWIALTTMFSRKSRAAFSTEKQKKNFNVETKQDLVV